VDLCFLSAFKGVGWHSSIDVFGNCAGGLCRVCLICWRSLAIAIDGLDGFGLLPAFMQYVIVLKHAGNKSCVNS
jgi:hypothetical protein